MITGAMKKRFSYQHGLLVCLFMLFITPVQADSLDKLMAKLSAAPEREALFVEERHAFYLDSPLKSQGHLKAIPPDRLEKTIISPEPIKQVIVGDRVIQTRNNVPVRELSLNKQPGLAAAINALRAVLFGNVAYLRKTFKIHFVNSDKQWSLNLLPLNKNLLKYIKSIRVSGVNDTIAEFRLTEANGDFSITRLYESKK
jgi:hypothetical protein